MKTFDKPLSPREEIEALTQSCKGNRLARNLLIERNLRLVAHIIKKYNVKESDMEDLISIGTIGLIKAVDTFDLKKAKKFSSYASKCIENELLMYFRSDKRKSKDVSMYEPVGTDKEGNEVMLYELIKSKDEDFLSDLIKRQDIQKLYNAVDNLSSTKEKEIIILRYGLYGKMAYTQKEIAKMYGISRSYVSRIEKKVLENLKKTLINE